MRYIELDELTKENIRDFIHQTTHTKQIQEQFVEFMDLIAPSYRIKIQNVMFLKTLKQNVAIKLILLAKKKLDR